MTDWVQVLLYMNTRTTFFLTTCMLPTWDTSSSTSKLTHIIVHNLIVQCLNGDYFGLVLILDHATWFIFDGYSLYYVFMKSKLAISFEWRVFSSVKLRKKCQARHFAWHVITQSSWWRTAIFGLPPWNISVARPTFPPKWRHLLRERSVAKEKTSFSMRLNAVCLCRY